MSEGKHIRFHQLLETHLNSIIQKRFVNRALTPEMMREMRNAIHETIGGVFAKSSHKLSARSADRILGLAWSVAATSCPRMR